LGSAERDHFDLVRRPLNQGAYDLTRKSCDSDVNRAGIAGGHLV